MALRVVFSFLEHCIMDCLGSTVDSRIGRNEIKNIDCARVRKTGDSIVYWSNYGIMGLIHLFFAREDL